MFRTIYQKGISLLEVMLSLSIIAIILVMATRYYLVASNTQSVNKLRAQVGSLIAAVTMWKHRHHSYSALVVDGIKVLLDDGDLTKSSDVNVTTGELRNGWGFLIELEATPTSYTIITEVPRPAECDQLAVSFPSATCGADNATFTLTRGITK